MSIYAKTTIAKPELNDILKSFIKCSDDDSLNVAMQLIKMGADPNTQDDDGNTILFTATSTGDLSIVFEMLKAGCNINIKNNANQYPISIALTSGNLNKIIWFLEHGSDATVLNKSPTKLSESVLFTNYYSDLDKIDIVQLFIDHGLQLTDRDYEGLTLADMVKAKKLEETRFGQTILEETEKVIQKLRIKHYIGYLDYLREHRLEEENNDYQSNINMCYNAIKDGNVRADTIDEEDNIIFYYLKTVEDVERFVQLHGNDAILQWFNDKTHKTLIDMAIEYNNEKLLRYYLDHNVGHHNQPEVMKILNENSFELSEKELEELEEYVPDLYILLNNVHEYLNKSHKMSNGNTDQIMKQNYINHLKLNFKLITRNKKIPMSLIYGFCDNIYNDGEMINKIMIKIISYFWKLDPIQYSRLFLGLFIPK